MKTKEEIKKEAQWRFTDGHGATDHYLVDVFINACEWIQETILEFDDSDRAKYYEDKIDMLNRIISENKKLFSEDDLRKAWNYEPKNNYEWKKFIKSTNIYQKWKTCENCDCGEFPKSICDCSCHDEATS